MEFICVKVTLRNLNPLYVAAFYRPPQDPADNLDGLEKAFDHLMDISNHNTKATFLVGGDFNADDIDRDSLAVKSSSDQKGISERIISFLFSHSELKCARAHVGHVYFCRNFRLGPC